MKKGMFILVLLIIIGSLIFQEVNITGHTVYYQGDSFESGGMTIKVIRISQSNAVIDVGGVKNIISIGSYKTINNVKIEVIDLFYTDEQESRNVDLAVNVLESTKCGDGECKGRETSENCCIDCGCQTNYVCDEGECVYAVKDKCKKHEDCDDNNTKTIDLCVDLNPKICKHFIEPEEELEELGYEIEENGEVEDLIEENGEEKQGFFSKIMTFFKGLLGS